LDNVVEQLERKAEQFARENCRLTRPLPEYDPDGALSESGEKYTGGTLTATSPVAWLAHVRHGCTNYDELIESLCKHRFADRIWYAVIRSRVTALLGDAALELECWPDVYSLFDGLTFGE
jgi:hypothetical protein